MTRRHKERPQAVAPLLHAHVPGVPDLCELGPDGRLGLNFHSGQWQAWESTRRFVAVLAGTQGGKTSWGPIWLWREIQRRGPGDYIAVTSTYDLFKLKMLPMLRDWFENRLGIGRYWGGDRVIEIADPATGRFQAARATDPMWARIILRSAESGSGLEAMTAKAAWLDEAGQAQFRVETWEAVLRRLSLSQGRALLTTTVYDLGWIKQHVYDRWKAGDLDFDVIQFDSTANPQFPHEEAARAKRTMPAWRYDMQYRGMFTRPAGLIYDCVQDEHVIPRFAVPAEWDRYLGLDFGGINTAGVWLAHEPGTRRLFAYREYKAGNRTAAEHTYHLLKGEPAQPVCFGGSQSEGQWRKEFAAGGQCQGQRVAGLIVRAPDMNDVELGIDRVYGAFMRNEVYVFDDLDGLLGQLRSYARKVDSNGEPTLAIENKEAFHWLDALRYILGYWCRPARTRIPTTEAERQAAIAAEQLAAKQAQADWMNPFHDHHYR